MARKITAPGEKPLYWMGSSRRDLTAFPERVQDEIGNALGWAQFGGTYWKAKPWHGLGPGIFEIVEDFDRGAYRAVYMVRFAQAVYVLHVFQKKSKSGKKTPARDVQMIRTRWQEAKKLYEEQFGENP